MVTVDNPILKIIEMAKGVLTCDTTGRTGRRGRPKTYTDMVMALVFIVMILKRIKTFKGIHRFLDKNPTIRKTCGLEKTPPRWTLSRRLKEFSPCGSQGGGIPW